MRLRATRLTHPLLNLLLLNPTDQWSYLCTHRSGWDKASRLLWFADAAQVATAQNQPDQNQPEWKQRQATVASVNQRDLSSEILDYLHHLHLPGLHLPGLHAQGQSTASDT
jgi:hypothetical protein